jgi:hypothetical protein
MCEGAGEEEEGERASSLLLSPLSPSLLSLTSPPRLLLHASGLAAPSSHNPHTQTTTRQHTRKPSPRPHSQADRRSERARASAQLNQPPLPPSLLPARRPSLAPSSSSGDKASAWRVCPQPSLRSTLGAWRRLSPRDPAQSEAVSKGESLSRAPLLFPPLNGRGRGARRRGGPGHRRAHQGGRDAGGRGARARLG